MLNALLDYKILIPLVLILGFAPFFPQPHIVEKLRMLANGTLKGPSTSSTSACTPRRLSCSSARSAGIWSLRLADWPFGSAQGPIDFSL